MQLKAIVTGANGMLGDSLCPLLESKGYHVVATDIVTNARISKLDIRNLDAAMAIVKKEKPGIIFHLAAETDVDKCETNEKHAYEINVKGTENIALCCKELDIPMVYVSTGSVFNGEKEGGYIEKDVAGPPVNIYGKSKLEGEKIVKALLSKYYIIRAGWMIGGYNKDKKFVWKIVELLKTKKEISAVIDKFGTLTFTKDFSKGMYDIVTKGEYGLYHCVNNGICTRFDIAKKIIEYLGKKDVILKPVDSKAFPMPAPRPKSEALINDRLSSMGMNNMRTWQEALREYIEEVK